MVSKADNVVRVAVDAMGGDYAPESQVKGTILAAKEKSGYLELTLVGKEEIIRDLLRKNGGEISNIKIENADEVITMHDSPSESFRTKPNSSLSVSLELQKQGLSDAAISAGNTGAILANSTLKLGRIQGVGRPTIGSIFPTDFGKTMVFDVGASVDCRASHLLEFAVMGSVFMNYMHNVDKPKVGLLSVGEEKSKGNDVTIEAYKLLEKSHLNFIGNVEGRDVLRGKADLVICDGFTGNIILKFAESVPDILKSRFRQHAEKSFLKKIWVGLMSKTLKLILKDFDYQEDRKSVV
jgi:fatty acid/phospholipid synthesis protein PlsX